MTEEKRDKRMEKSSSDEGANSLGEGADTTSSSVSGKAGGKEAGGAAGRTRGGGRSGPQGKGVAAARAKREKVEDATSPPEQEKGVSAAPGESETAPRETEMTEGKTASSPGEAEKKEMGEEEFRRLVEESLERVTVAEVTLTVMNQFASLGYLKMGLPESVNLKYRDLSQALLAIDMLEAMIKGAEGKIPEDSLKPFRGTLANLQLNYVQLKKRLG